jgi:hypothetical protein
MRHQFYAHLDPRHIDNPQNLWQNAGLAAGEVQELVDRAFDIVNTYSSLYLAERTLSRRTPNIRHLRAETRCDPRSRRLRARP